MAQYLFNWVKGNAVMGSAREVASALLGAGMWGIDADEPHLDALAVGDLILIYVGAPERVFIGRAELASSVHEWTSSEGQEYPGRAPGGVLLTRVAEWDPPVPMKTVLSQMDPSENAKADFHTGVVRITAKEYATALAVAARQ